MAIRPFEEDAGETHGAGLRHASLAGLGNSRMSGVDRTMSTDTDLFASFVAPIRTIGLRPLRFHPAGLWPMSEPFRGAP